MDAFFPKQGEVYIVDFEPQVGSEIKKVRPAVVVGILAEGGAKIVQVVPLSTHEGKGREHNVKAGIEVVIDFHLEPGKRSRAVCSQISTFDKARFRSHKPLKTLSKEQTQEVLKGVARVLGLAPLLSLLD
jgi:mRNA interferase MazF